MLRTYTLALAALNARARFAEVLCDVLVILALRRPALVQRDSPAAQLLHIGVVQREILRDCNPHRAAVRAVRTARTRNIDARVDDVRRLFDERFFLIVQRLKILHVRCVVQKLVHIAHAGKHDLHVRQARCETNCPRRYGSFWIIVLKQLRHFFRYVCKRAALHRLHDEYRHAVLFGNFVAFSGLHTGAFPVEVVEL